MTRVIRAHIAKDGVVMTTCPAAIELSETMMTLYRRLVESLAGCDVDITIAKHRAQMSDRSRRYYFSVIVPLIAEYCGYEKDEMHEALAWKFLRIEDDDLTGTPRRKHLPALDSPDGAEYLDRCIRFGAELGVYIPAPGEVVA